MTQLQLTENSISTLLAPKKADIVKMIGAENLTRETSFALQAVNSNSYLAKSTPVSVAKAIMNVALTGLTLHPNYKMAYLVPKQVNGNVEAVLMPSYMGLVKLITDTGSVTSVEARIVYNDDFFEVNYGSERSKIEHKPQFKNQKNEDIQCVYAVAKLRDGNTQFEIMSISEINEIRNRSDGYKAFIDGKAKSAIWVTDFNEMAKKTVIKRLCKYLPKSEKWDKINEAIALDNKDYPASMSKINYIQSLADMSTFDERSKKVMLSGLDDITYGAADDLINILKENQLQNLDLPQYSAKDINSAVQDSLNKENN